MDEDTVITNQSELETLNVNELRTNATLQKDEWEEIDEAAVRVARKRRTLMSDLMDAGLTVDAGGLGTTEWTYDALKNVSDAEINLDTVTAIEEDSQNYEPNTVPVPMLGKSFRLSQRRLEASRKLGQGLDTTGVEAASRKVNDKGEDLIMNGSSLQFNGNSIEGLTNKSAGLDVSLSDNWDTSSGTPIDDSRAMVGTAFENGIEGPFNLYYPLNYHEVMLDDYSDSKGDRTVMERIEAIEGIEDVSASAALADDTVVLVQMDSQTIQLAIAQDLTNIEWSDKGGLVNHYMTMMAFAPVVKTRYTEDGNTVAGVVVLS